MPSGACYRLFRVEEPDVGYACDLQSFRPAQSHHVRWLDIDDDFDVLERFHSARDQSRPYTRADAAKWKETGFRDAGIVEGAVLTSRAALWTYSDDAWELAGVFTSPDARRTGQARSVCTFVTAAILRAEKLATCHTAPSNVPMRRLAESLGYTLMSSRASRA